MLWCPVICAGVSLVLIQCVYISLQTYPCLDITNLIRFLKKKYKTLNACIQIVHSFHQTRYRVNLHSSSSQSIQFLDQSRFVTAQCFPEIFKLKFYLLFQKSTKLFRHILTIKECELNQMLY